MKNSRTLTGMKKKDTYWSEYRFRCRDELLGNIMLFWMKHGLDKKNGGVYTCLDRDGTLIDTTKSVWFQGRFGYIAAYVYNNVKKDKRFLEASLSCCEFLEKHCFDSDGRAFFEVTEDGVGLRKRRYVFPIDLLVKHFIHPEFKALLEMVGPNGEFIDTFSGRVINPGHCIETSWFLMDVAVARNDSDLLKTALKILDWSWNWGWDKKYGGIISFKDCRNLPPQCYEQDMKFWWQ